jgi:hypothetical protein
MQLSLDFPPKHHLKIENAIKLGPWLLLNASEISRYWDI